MLRFFTLAILASSALAQGIAKGSDTLTSCPIGVGFADWPTSLNSRATNTIFCFDGQTFSSAGITANAFAGEDFAIVMRPLGKGIVRQGFQYGALSIPAGTVGGLTSFCFMDTAPQVSLATGAIAATASCLGNIVSSTGSPFIEDTIATNIRHGWQVFNPPGAVAAAVANGNCGAYVSNGNAASNTYGFIAPSTLNANNDAAACQPAPANLYVENANNRKYGGNTNGFLGLVNQMTNANIGQIGALATAVVAVGATLQSSIATPLFSQPTSALGFQLGCAVNTVDETKWMALTMWSLTTQGTFAVATDPVAALSTTIFRITCQNVATSTPTPPMYPTAAGGALPVVPEAAPFPITAGAAGSIQITFKSCTGDCISATKQARIVSNTQTICLANNNVGCSVTVTCLVNNRCLNVPDTTTLTSRRGLKQIQVYEQVVTATTRDIRTAQYLGNQVRAGALEGDVSAFSFLTGYSTSPSLVNTPFPVSAPSAAVPNNQVPSPNQPWTGITYVDGTCTSGSCTGYCTSGPINKVSNFAESTGSINCFCNDCNVPIARGLKQSTATSAYRFSSAICATSSTQTAANTCAANVAQDVVCFVLATPGSSTADINAIQAGLWTYQPPSVGGGAPQASVAAPTSCPSSSSSPKGLLGLLGLLALIPLLLCCCLLLLCLIRRKKREGDVHFATFDPQAANMGAPASIPAMGMSPCPAPMPIM